MISRKDRQHFWKFRKRFLAWIESGKKLELKPRINRENPLITEFLKPFEHEPEDFYSISVGLTGDEKERERARHREYYAQRRLKEGQTYTPRVGNGKDIVVSVAPKILEYQLDITTGKRCLGCFELISPNDQSIDVANARSHMNYTCMDKAKEHVTQLEEAIRRRK